MNNKLLAVTAVRIHPGFPAHLHGDDQYVGAVGFKNYIRFGNEAVPAEQNDFVFGGEISQEIVFEFAVKSFIEKFLKGQDVSIVAYGDHYTGKSYTVFGPGFHYTDSEFHFGMLPRAISYIFSQIEPHKTDCDNVSYPHLKISMFELFGFGMKDLLSTSGEVITLPTIAINEKGFLTFSVIKRDCFSAMEAMQIVTFGMNQRTINPHTMQHLGTVIVKLELNRPEMKGAEVESQILFVDLACHNVTHPVYKNSVHLDIHLLTLLANSKGNTVPTDETNLFQGCLHFKVFQDFFKDNIESLFICCVSPRKSDIQLTALYMSVLWHIYRNKSLPDPTETEGSPDVELHCEQQMNQSQMSTMLMTQAESLFSQLSNNSSLGDEEREMMRMWIELKQEIIDETVNAQNHPHLERIEEVTESEEELASSDGRVSDQENSEDNSVHESDQEELDQKVCLLSESDFLENVEDMHMTFCSYVDSQVDTVVLPILSPPDDQKTSCTATRRDIHQLPITAPQSIWVQDLAGQVTATVKQTCPTVLREDHHLTAQEKNKSNDVLDNHPKGGHGVCQSNLDANRLQLDFSSNSKTSSSKAVTKGNVLEENDDLTNLAIIQYRFEDLVRKCQAVLPSKLPSNRGEEARSASPFRKRTHFFEVMKKINDDIVLLEQLVSTNDGGSDADSVDNAVSLQDHRLRMFRSVREKVIMSKSKLDSKIKSKVYYSEDLRSYLIADEMIEILDRSNEFLNCIRLNKEVPYPQHDHLETWKMAENCIHELLLPSEMKHLLTYYFMKVIDLRESTLGLESSISTMEKSLHACHLKINSLGLTIVKLRNQKTGRSEVDCYKPHSNKVPTKTLAMSQEQGACGGAGSSTIPQQNLSKLQVSKCEPPPKVVRSQNNKKLVVELSRKKL